MIAHRLRRTVDRHPASGEAPGGSASAYGGERGATGIHPAVWGLACALVVLWCSSTFGGGL